MLPEWKKMSLSPQSLAQQTPQTATHPGSCAVLLPQEDKILPERKTPMCKTVASLLLPVAALSPLHRHAAAAELTSGATIFVAGQPLEIQWEVGKAIKTPASVPLKRDAPSDRWPKWWQAQGLDRHSLVGGE